MGRSKSGLFLMELIIAITFFAVASAICIQLFAAAHTMSSRSIGIQMAVANAQSAAESFKMTDGDMDTMAGLLGATLAEGRLVVEFDENWAPTASGRYRMVVEADFTIIPAAATIVVTDEALERELYSITVRRYLRFMPELRS